MFFYPCWLSFRLNGPVGTSKFDMHVVPILFFIIYIGVLKFQHTCLTADVDVLINNKEYKNYIYTDVP